MSSDAALLLEVPRGGVALSATDTKALVAPAPHRATVMPSDAARLSTTLRTHGGGRGGGCTGGPEP